MRPTNARLLGVCLAAAAGIAPGLARAQAWAAPSGLHGGGLGLKEDPSAVLWADTAFFHKDDVSFLSPIFGVGVFLSPQVELDVVLPTSVPIGKGDPVVGNPYAGVSYVHDGPAYRLKVGGGVTFPTLSLDTSQQIGAILGGVFTRGAQESWLFYADALAVVAPLHIEAPLGSPVFFIGDAALAFLVPIRNRRDSEVMVQVAPGLAVNASDTLALGLRLPVWFVPTSDANDKTQVSAEPFVRLAVEPAFISLRFTMPLDEPLGFAFDRYKFWGLHLGFGAEF